MKTNFLGTGVAMITPFKEDKSVDFDALKRMINHLIDGQVEYILVMGTTAAALNGWLRGGGAGGTVALSNWRYRHGWYAFKV